MDSILDLPINEMDDASTYDKEIVDTYFKSKNNKFILFINHFRTTFIITVLFLILSLRIIDRFIELLIPQSKDNVIILLLCKSILFFILHYIISIKLV